MSKGRQKIWRSRTDLVISKQTQFFIRLWKFYLMIILTFSFFLFFFIETLRWFCEERAKGYWHFNLSCFVSYSSPASVFSYKAFSSVPKLRKAWLHSSRSQPHWGWRSRWRAPCCLRWQKYESPAGPPRSFQSCQRLETQSKCWQSWGLTQPCILNSKHVCQYKLGSFTYLPDPPHTSFLVHIPTWTLHTPQPSLQTRNLAMPRLPG